MDASDHPDRIPEVRCASCGALSGYDCSECGQRRARRLSFRRILSEALEHLLALDSAFLRTLIGLTKHPGRVCRRYVLGQRKTYVNPLKYTFVVATVCLLTYNFFRSPSPAGVDAASETDRARIAIMPFAAYFGYVVMIPVVAAFMVGMGSVLRAVRAFIGQG